MGGLGKEPTTLGGATCQSRQPKGGSPEGKGELDRPGSDSDRSSGQATQEVGAIAGPTGWRPPGQTTEGRTQVELAEPELSASLRRAALGSHPSLAALLCNLGYRPL